MWPTLPSSLRSWSSVRSSWLASRWVDTPRCSWRWSALSSFELWWSPRRAPPRVTKPAAEVAQLLSRWPLPFPSRDAAVEFFGGPSLSAETWADGLEQRDDGWWPRFDSELMVRTLREAVERPYWEEWERISCPVLVVRACDGSIPAADAQAMADRLPQARLVELTGAEHDLHLDRPAGWRRALSGFLDSLDG
jgi:pimeloyl-ACP methyl ester carboxylesterase